MEAERWRTISRLCHEALDRSPEERRSFLDAACLGDEVLRREVESLIEQAAATGRFSDGFASLVGREHSVTTQRHSSAAGGSALTSFTT